MSYNTAMSALECPHIMVGMFGMLEGEPYPEKKNINQEKHIEIQWNSWQITKASSSELSWSSRLPILSLLILYQ